MWQRYTVSEARAGCMAEAQAVMGRCLNSLPHVGLWREYVRLVQEVHLMPVMDALAQAGPGSAEEHASAVQAARNLVSDAFEFALGKVGLLWGAEVLWREYISFLKQTPEGNWYATSQASEMLRKTFLRALAVPQPDMNSLLDAYRQFEREQSDDEEAKKAVEAVLPRVDAAKKVQRQRDRLWRHLNLGALALPPWRAPKGGQGQGTQFRYCDRDQVLRWLQVALEESTNPLQLEPGAAVEHARSVFELALLYTRYYPDVWFAWSSWELERGEHDAALRLLLKAVQVLPECNTLAYRAADMAEAAGDVTRARDVYEFLLERAPSTLTYILYQRFARRCLGVHAARQVFRRARTSDHAAPAMFLASAELEYYANRSLDVSARVLELGRKRWPEDVQYAVACIDFLTPVTDDANMRLLFENVLASLPGRAAAPVWDRYLAYEQHKAAGGGTMEAVHRLEARRMVALTGSERAQPGPQALLAGMHRYNTFGLLPSGAGDKDLLSRHPWSTQHFHTASGAHTAARTEQGRPVLSAAPSTTQIADVAAGAATASLEVQRQGEELYRTQATKVWPDNAPDWLRHIFDILPPWLPTTVPKDPELRCVIVGLRQRVMPPRPDAASGNMMVASNPFGGLTATNEPQSSADVMNVYSSRNLDAVRRARGGR